MMSLGVCLISKTGQGPGGMIVAVLHHEDSHCSKHYLSLRVANCWNNKDIGAIIRYRSLLENCVGKTTYCNTGVSENEDTHKIRIKIWINMSEIGNDGSVAFRAPPHKFQPHTCLPSPLMHSSVMSFLLPGLQGWASSASSLRVAFFQLVRTAAPQLRSVEWVGVSYFGAMKIQNCQLFWYEQKIRNGYHGFDPAKSVRQTVRMGCQTIPESCHFSSKTRSGVTTM